MEEIMARKKIVAGNWKMNMTPSQAVALAEELKPLVASDDVDVVYCVPAIDIVPVIEAVKGTNVAVGAENMYYEEKGAYTGEISPEMLVDAGVKYVIIGHSERRDYFKECDCMLNKKVKKAFEHNLIPILCCGESLEQREMGVTLDWIRLQIKSDLQDVTAEQVASMVIAYEPIWRSERAAPRRRSRRRKSAGRSVTASRRFMIPTRRRRSVFSTAVP